MSTTIRVATPEDADAILAIYAPIVQQTAISFEVEPPTLMEMQARIAKTLQQPSLGFQPVGVYQTVGYKLGAWHDVGWWQRGLKPCLSHPDPPTTFAVLRQTSPVRAAALNAGLPFLRV
jgi:L-amino acid N-acyltransferase YncA